MKFWTTIIAVLFCISATAATLEDSGVDYGDDMRIDRVNAVPTHAADGRYMRIDTLGGLQVNAVPTPGENLLSVEASGTPLVTIDDDGTLNGDGSGLTALNKLEIQQAYRVLEVSTDGNDTTAATGVGPFASVYAAVEYANTTLSVSSAAPVTVLVHPGEYDGSGLISGVHLYDGVQIIGLSRESVTLFETAFNIQDGTAAISNLTWENSNTEHGSGFSAGMVAAGATIELRDIDFISTQDYAEGSESVALFNWATIDDTVNMDILLSGCSVNIECMLFFFGHPTAGDRDCIVNATLENCYIRSAPTGSGPVDPHFLINWWQPGTLTIKNSHLLYDLDNFTDSDDLHGLILMQNEDGNDYPSGGLQALNVYNSKLELRDNGLSSGYTIPIIQVNAASGKNRCTVNLEDVTLVRDADVDCDLFTSNQSTVYYRGTNLIDWTAYGTAATVTILSDGNKKFENVTIGGTLGVSGALTASGTASFGDNGSVPTGVLSIQQSSDNISGGLILYDSSSKTGSGFFKEAGSNGGIVARSQSKNTLLIKGGNVGVGVGATSPSGRLEIDVGSSDAVSALVLDQNDEDQPFISFEGTAEDAYTKNISYDEDGYWDGASPNIFLRIKINGAVYWIPGYQEVE